MLLEKLKIRHFKLLKRVIIWEKVSDIGYVYQDRATMSNELA